MFKYFVLTYEYIMRETNFEVTIFLLILERSLYNHGFAMVGVFSRHVYVLAGEQRQYWD